MSLRKELVKLARKHPETQRHLVPILKQARWDHRSTPLQVIQAVGKGIGKKGTRKNELAMSFELDSPTISDVAVGFAQTTFHGGEYAALSISAITMSGTKHLQTFTFPDGVFFLVHTNSWWFVDHRVKDPGHNDEPRVRKAIAETVADVVQFLKGYIRKAESTQSLGPDVQLALKLNKAMRLGLDETSLAALIEAMN